MPNLVAKVTKSSIIRNLAILASGSALAQLIGVIAAPLLTRLYSPEDFGIVGSVLAVAGVLTVITSFKYEMALVLEKDNNKVAALQILCQRLLCATTLVFGLAILMSCWFIVDRVDETLFFLWAVPLIYMTGLYNIYRFRINREARYKAISVSTVARRLTLVGSQIFLGLCGAEATGLLLGNVLGCSIAVLLLFWSEKHILTNYKQEKAVSGIWKTYYRFPLYSAPQNLLSSISQNLPVYFIGYFYGLEVVGAYWFVVRLLQLPAGVITQAVRQVFYKQYTEMVDELPKLKREYLRAVFLLSGLALLPALPIFIYGYDLFVWFFGDNWTLSGSFLQWVYLWVCMELVSSAARGLFDIYKKQNVLLSVEIVFTILRLSALIFGGMMCSSVDTVFMFSILSLMLNMYMVIYWIFKFWRVK